MSSDTRLGDIRTNGINRVTGTRRITTDQIRSDLDKLHGLVDRRLFGSRYHKRSSKGRTEFLGFIEHLNSNAHVHLAWRVPEDRLSDFAKIVTHAWSKIGPALTADVRDVRDAGWGEYIIKDQRGDALLDASLFVSSRSIDI